MKSYVAAMCLVCAILLPLSGHTADFGNPLHEISGGRCPRSRPPTPRNGSLPRSTCHCKDGDQIWVPDNARSEVFTANGTIVRLDRNSYLEMLDPEDHVFSHVSGSGPAVWKHKLCKR